MSFTVPIKQEQFFLTNFPKELDFNRKDSVTEVTYGEAYERAKKCLMPYFPISVLESGEGNDLTFEIYETQPIRYFKMVADLKKINLLDPNTGQAVKRIYNFFLPCYRVDANEVCKPVSLQDNNIISLTCVDEILDKFDGPQRELLWDGVNRFVEESEDFGKSILLRRTQYVVSRILKEINLEPYIKGSEHSLLWLYCAAKHSLRAKIQLAISLNKGCEMIKQNKEKAAELIEEVLMLKLEEVPEYDLSARRQAQGLKLMKFGDS